MRTTEAWKGFGQLTKKDHGQRGHIGVQQGGPQMGGNRRHSPDNGCLVDHEVRLLNSSCGHKEPAHLKVGRDVVGKEPVWTSVGRKKERRGLTCLEVTAVVPEKIVSRP